MDYEKNYLANKHHFVKVGIVTLCFGFFVIFTLTAYVLYFRAKSSIEDDTFNPTDQKGKIVSSLKMQPSPSPTAVVPTQTATAMPIPPISRMLSSPLGLGESPQTGADSEFLGGLSPVCSSDNGICGKVVVSKNRGSSNNVITVFVKQADQNDTTYKMMGIMPNVQNTNDSVLGWNWNGGVAGRQYSIKTVVMDDKKIELSQLLPFAGKYTNNVDPELALVLGKLALSRTNPLLSFGQLLSVANNKGLDENDKKVIMRFLNSIHWYEVVSSANFMNISQSNTLTVTAPENGIVISL